VGRPVLVTGAPRALAASPIGLGIMRQRCDPYGRESRIQLEGGIHPESRASATALAIGFCPRPAEAVYRMICRCGHRGQRMPLCGPGLVQDARGEWYPHPGHVASIQRRQAGLCPPCAHPPAARELEEAMQARMTDIARAQAAGLLVARAKLVDALDQLREQMTELAERGIVHRCPLVLIEVS